MNTLTLRPHQERFIKQNPDYALLVWSMRTGKTLPAKLWSENPGRNKNAVVVCLKSNKSSWKKECPNALVLTKEEFKKDWKKIIQPSCLVVDEAHNFAAPLFIAKKRSQQAEAMYTFIKKNPQMHVLLLTATPLTNDPASIHTLLTYIGHYIDWKIFQHQFYELQYKPFLPRPAYFPIKNWRIQANELIKKYCDVVSLSDCVDVLPPVEDIVIKVKSSKYEYAEDEDYLWTKEHKNEQLNKVDVIKEIGNECRKVILVCKYTEQIDYLADKLKNDKPVFILDGRTKDQGQTIVDAQQSPDAYLIVQAMIGMGWDGYMFDCLVFVSMSHRVIDFQQMYGRLVSLDFIKPLIYYYLLSEGNSWDNKIYQSIIRDGVDFNIHNYEK